MHGERSEFNGQNRVSVYGYFAKNSKRVDFRTIWESNRQYLNGSLYSSILLDLQTEIRDPSNVKHGPATFRSSLQQIEQHVAKKHPNSLTIIMRDEALVENFTIRFLNNRYFFYQDLVFLPRSFLFTFQVDKGVS